MKFFWFILICLGLSLMARPVLAATTSSAILVDPLPNTRARITKKYFSTFVTPKNSPVKPESFRGYHTGVDLETTADEANIDVPVSAACTGAIHVERWASGYGGVVVQACSISGKAVTVIYGHLRLASVKYKVGQSIKQGQAFAVLGTGYSHETDGERKHLHFAIHRGTSINLLGYVQHKISLANWLDPLELMK